MTTPRGRGDAPIEAPANPKASEFHFTVFCDARDSDTGDVWLHRDDADKMAALFNEALAAARAEGRREAVRRIEAIDHPCHDVCIGNLHADCQCAAWIRQEAISAVAGLNASESPPTEQTISLREAATPAAPPVTWPMAGPAPTGTVIPGLDDEATSPAALGWAQRAIDRMLRAADTETRYWIEGIVREERARLTEQEDRHD